jgi:hypothetical protein
MAIRGLVVGAANSDAAGQAIAAANPAPRNSRREMLLEDRFECVRIAKRRSSRSKGVRAMI